MANRRSKVVNAISHPAIMPGLSILADTVTMANTEVLTITFPAKSILAVVAQSFLDVDAEKVVATAVVSNNVGTVTLTKTSANTDKVSYIIFYTIVETITANDLSGNTSETPVT